MRLGDPWSVSGVRPDARETAQEAARRSGMPVGEWLNSIIATASRNSAQARDHAIPERDSSGDGDHDVSGLHERLDDLTRMLEGLAQTASANTAGPLTSAISQFDEDIDRLIAEGRSAAKELDQRVSAFDRVFATIAREPKREALADTTAFSPRNWPPGEVSARWQMPEVNAPSLAPAAAIDQEEERPYFAEQFSSLERQLQNITSQIETLRQPCDIDAVASMLRADLAEFAGVLKEAMPRRAIEALETEVKVLTRRLDEGRRNGSDADTVAAVERGLAEVRDALHRLTPAENVGVLDHTVKILSDRIDQIAAAGEDPRGLQQLEAVITELRGMISRVASSEALGDLAAEVLTLAGKIEYGFTATAGADALRTLDGRIGAIADALEATRKDHERAVTPRLDAMIKGLSDKLEKFESFQPRPDEQAIYSHLEDRISRLVEKLEASEARLGHLPSIENGISELLAQLEALRADKASQAIAGNVLRNDAAGAGKSQPVSGHSETRNATAISRELPAVVTPSIVPEPDPAPAQHALSPSSVISSSKPKDHSPRTLAPIDPNLPPDHPLEPGPAHMHGAAAQVERVAVSRTDRIAAAEAALASAKSAASAPGQTSNFIAAARRAAKAAVIEPASPGAPRVMANAASDSPAKPKRKLGERIKSILVGLSVVAIVLGAVRMTLNYMEISWPAEISRNGQDVSGPAAPSAPVPVAPEQSPPSTPDRQSGLNPAGSSLVLPIPAASMIEASTPAHVTPPQTGSAVTGAASLPDVTGSLDQTQIMPLAQGSTGSSLPSPAWPAGSGDLPAVIGGSTLRGAAADGDPAAAFEVAARYAEGRGVPMNLPEAVRWFAYAASHGLAPAQFRLGSLYEKGQGVKKDLNEARRLYLAAAEQGNAKAMHNLAVLYAEGIEGKPDYKIAAEWFLKASNRDVADSQYNLGILYARGIGIGQNLPEAYKWFTLAARKGDNDAAKKRDDVGGRLDPQALMAARLAMQTWVAEPQPEGAMIVKTPPGGWDTPPARVQPAKSKTRPKV